eukprot:TRINITY_DN4985_c4_g1_i1.p1 TRINITY_DN4985_c4_g1~~TRINITY_DN4985_c4_g1_i1.p1  ORF type:complete len:179 (+),score=32.25 TRINITY_DN4985_c4_g1_i1:47-538(+)
MTKRKEVDWGKEWKTGAQDTHQDVYTVNPLKVTQRELDPSDRRRQNAFEDSNDAIANYEIGLLKERERRRQACKHALECLITQTGWEPVYRNPRSFCQASCEILQELQLQGFPVTKRRTAWGALAVFRATEENYGRHEHSGPAQLMQRMEPDRFEDYAKRYKR